MSPDEPAEIDVTKVNFADVWNSVLAGDMAAKEAVLNLVQRAILPVLKSGSSGIEPAELAATVQRTLLRRIRDDASVIKAATLEDFIKYAREQARNKKRKPFRRNNPVQLPEYADDAGVVRTHDPVDALGKQPEEEAIDNEFVAALIEALEQRGEPDYSIVMGDHDDEHIANRLGITVNAVQKRRRRVLAAIREMIGVDE
jgi:DNA-directed RNA polymerase specialized sigma24 family protein